MLEETELVKKLRAIVWEADLCTTTAGIIRKKLEDHFGVDLSSKKQKRLINLQINSFLEEQLKTEALNEEVRGEAGAQKEQKVETSEKVEGYRKMDVLKEEERGIGNGTKSCFQNLKDPSKGKETERQSKEEEEEEDATSKSKEAVEQPNRAREDEAPTKLKEREKQPNNRGEEAPSQSKETVVQLISAGEEEIPSKSKKSKRERQEDMEKSEKPRKKPKRTKVKAPSKSKKPSKQPIQAEEGVAPKSDEAEKQHKEGEEEVLLKTKEKESQRQMGTEAKSPPNDKDQKRAGSAFLDPLPISDALVKFLGTDETALSRTEAVKKIWIHIKQKKLQDCSDKQKVICDDKLKELFQVESFSGFKVQKLLEPHFPQDVIV